MKTQKNYGWLDRFRLITALLVIAIHTSPLISFSMNADFFFTRVLARVAVPFFFMVTGHFTLSALFFSDDTGHSCPPQLQRASAWHAVKRCILKLSLLYGAAILLYLPLGIYAGHYRGLSITEAMRMLIFDGTFYHLWYFPACILGVLIVSLLSRFCSLRTATVISSLLYAAGLLGDSYFGLTAKIPFLNSVYEVMFHFFSYTRNGLFLAPLFLLLGICTGNFSSLTESRYEERAAEAGSATLRHKNGKDLLLRPLPCATFLAVSLGAMTAEAFLLRSFSLQRHDSMYIFLVPVMSFLYRLLLSLPGAASQKKLRTAALWIYILHPAFIVVVRGAAKSLHLTAVLVDNSLIHYLTVALLSAAAGIFLTILLGKISEIFPLRLNRQANPVAGGQLDHQPGVFFSRRIRHGCTISTTGDSAAYTPLAHRAWIELDMDALENNVRFLQSRLPSECKLMPAVKANAYGHGAVAIAKELNRLGINSFCVACISEGVELRKAGIKGEILILGYTSPDQFPRLRRYRLTQTVVDYAYAESLQKSGIRLHVHIAVDTGMHRLGIRCEDTEQIAAIYEIRNLLVDGIYTHLSACDSDTSESRSFTESQIAAFFQVIEVLKAKGCPCKGLHLLSSYGILNYPDATADYVRPGIALYGLLSRDEDNAPSLRPVLSLKAQVSSLRTLHIGESAGYGLSFTADRDMKLAILSIGYADGLPRTLSDGNGRVLINGYSAPVIGRICMDQTLVDVSRIPTVTQGDTAILIGRSGMQEITAGELAERCGTITNEILSRLGGRLERTRESSN